LDDLEQGEAHSLLERWIAVECDVRTRPHPIQVGALGTTQSFPARPLGRGERSVDLIAK
jgi:hypothetical protein